MEDELLNSDRLIRGLIEGDNEIYQEFWERYGSRLQALVSKKLPQMISRRTEPDDVVQSVCRTFFRRVQDGRFELADSEDLWRLLCAISITKVQKQMRYQNRQKRTPGREQYFASSDETSAGLPEPKAEDHSPSQIAALSEEFENLMNLLDEDEQILVQLKLEERSEKEIAQQLRCSTRTVRRVLKRVRSKLQSTLID